ncbi:MAG TPA: hypothetical protein VKZ50_03535 [bacterium]|nr:hypothetical protein [bacterium]
MTAVFLDRFHGHEGRVRDAASLKYALGDLPSAARPKIFGENAARVY